MAEEEEILPAGPWSCDPCDVDNAKLNTFCKLCTTPFISSGPGEGTETKKRDKADAERQKIAAAAAAKQKADEALSCPKRGVVKKRQVSKTFF